MRHRSFIQGARAAIGATRGTVTAETQRQRSEAVPPAITQGGPGRDSTGSREGSAPHRRTGEEVSLRSHRRLDAPQADCHTTLAEAGRGYRARS